MFVRRKLLGTRKSPHPPEALKKFNFRKLWERIIEGDESAVSCLTAYELKRLSLMGVINSEAADAILEAIPAISKVVWLDKTEIFIAAATISRSYGIHAMDALILASLASLNVKTIYTTDAHFEKYRKRGVSIALLPRGSGGER